MDMFPESDASSGSGSTSPSNEQNGRGSREERGSPGSVQERSAFETTKFELGGDVHGSTGKSRANKTGGVLVAVASTGTSTDEKWGASWLQQVGCGFSSRPVCVCQQGGRVGGSSAVLFRRLLGCYGVFPTFPNEFCYLFRNSAEEF